MDAKPDMVAGIAALDQEDFTTALLHFDRAVALRKPLPWRHDPASAWLFAAAHINRSDALRKLMRPVEAIASLDIALEALQCVPLDLHPQCTRRVLLAHINRATALHESGNLTAARAAFDAAERFLLTHRSATFPDKPLLTSMLHANRALARMDDGDAAGAWQDSCEAVNALTEDSSPPGDAAVKARVIQCKALAHLLETPDGSDLVGDWIAHATDTVEEALSLVRDHAIESEWTADLIRYGARIYRNCQPHFLGEFIHEWLGAGAPLSKDPALRQDMKTEILLATVRLEQCVRTNPHDTPLVQAAIRILESLQSADAIL